MTAYVVFMRESTLDAAELETYWEKVPAARVGHEITSLARYGEIDLLEGAPIEGAVILQFSTIEQARNWYHSPAYQDAKKHREKGAEYRAFIIDGVDSGR
ncbi:DUF1330 domain-containing protein [Ensifer sp. YR511]|uniref:DUF1330 domain-containing protein n=1 Tax=Ensifer sp. YR511 TaxID=1855294 RepID=UPI00088F6572|nr:DUF1330 domain-containing protein [Ensifer sp. YR511]SDN03327.1 Uncharacterized conserved protein, DUF1330 family [Ensifer sp. YR511]